MNFHFGHGVEVYTAYQNDAFRLIWLSMRRTIIDYFPYEYVGDPYRENAEQSALVLFDFDWVYEARKNHLMTSAPVGRNWISPRLRWYGEVVKLISMESVARARKYQIAFLVVYFFNLPTIRKIEL